MTLQQMLDQITAQAKAKGVDPNIVLNHQMVIDGSKGELTIDIQPMDQKINLNLKFDI